MKYVHIANINTPVKFEESNYSYYYKSLCNGYTSTVYTKRLNLFQPGMWLAGFSVDETELSEVSIVPRKLTLGLDTIVLVDDTLDIPGYPASSFEPCNACTLLFQLERASS